MHIVLHRSVIRPLKLDPEQILGMFDWDFRVTERVGKRARAQ